MKNIDLFWVYLPAGGLIWLSSIVVLLSGYLTEGCILAFLGFLGFFFAYHENTKAAERNFNEAVYLAEDMERLLLDLLQKQEKKDDSTS